MTEQPFDRRLKEVLENLEPPYNPTTWEQLQRRLDAQMGDVPPAADDDAWDASIRERLERLSAPYEAAGWQALLAKMRLQTRRQQHVYGAKAVEMLLLLLLMLLWDFEPGHPPARPHIPSSSQAVAQHAEDVGGAQPVPAEHSLAPSLAFSKSSRVSGTDEIGAAHPARSDEPQPQGAEEYPNLPLPYSSDAVARAAQLPLCPASLSPLPVPMPEPLSSVASPSAAMAPAPFASRPEPASERRLYLLGAVVVQRNHVLLSDAQSATYGHGFSLRAEYRRRAWAWSTGLDYASLAFVPQYRERIFQGMPQTGYYAASMAEVRADMLMLPLVVSRRVWSTERWQAWISGGLTAHLALDKAYDYDYIYYPPGHLPLTQADPNAQPHLLERGRGLFEKGGLASNAYASADLGIRWEYGAPGSRYAWYVQPLYRRGLTPGIGPNAERLHAWVLQVGLRMAP
jgi:hypothetical protein